MAAEAAPLAQLVPLAAAAARTAQVALALMDLVLPERVEVVATPDSPVAEAARVTLATRLAMDIPVTVAKELYLSKEE